MRPRDRAALAAVAAALVFAVLAIGGAPRWAACGAALLGVASAAPYVTSRRTSSSLSPLLRPLVVVVGLTALQLLPLTEAIAEQVAPAKLELVRENAAAWGAPAPAWTMASFDPPATLVELAKLAGYLALAWTCVRLASNRRARRWLAVIAVGVATLAAAVTLAHHAAGARQLYGVVDPGFRPEILGPLLGVNHLASLLSIAVPIALALAITSTGPARLGWLAAAAVLAGTTLLTGSRGGLVGLLAGLVVAIALLVVQRRAGATDPGRRVPVAIALPAGIVATCAVALLAIFTAGPVAGELRRTSLDEVHDPRSKYQVWSQAIPLLTENRMLGAGKGAFEPAFTPHAAIADATYSHAENSYLQAALDWGLPGAALLAIALVLAARAGARRWRHGPVEAGVIGGLVGLAVHELADFSIELPAVAMLAIVAASILFPATVGTATVDGGARAKAAPRRAVATRLALIGAAAAVVALAASPVGRSARANEAWVAAAPDAATRAARARAAMTRHPADYAIAGRAAEALFAERDPRAVKLVTRALRRNPAHPGLHHLAAHMLARSQRPEQAAVELAAAARWARDVAPIVADAIRMFETPERVAAALPPEPRQAARILAALRGHPGHALAYARRVGDAHPRDPLMQSLLARAALDARAPDVALPAARIAWERQPNARHATLLGRSLAGTGRQDEAVAVLQRAAEAAQEDLPAERIGLLFALSEILIALDDLAGAKHALERAGNLSGTDRNLRYNVHLRMASVEDRLGNVNQAAWERARARELEEDLSGGSREKK